MEKDKLNIDSQKETLPGAHPSLQDYDHFEFDQYELAKFLNWRLSGLYLKFNEIENGLYIVEHGKIPFPNSAINKLMG